MALSPPRETKKALVGKKHHSRAPAKSTPTAASTKNDKLDTSVELIDGKPEHIKCIGIWFGAAFSLLGVPLSIVGCFMWALFALLGFVPCFGGFALCFGGMKSIAKDLIRTPLAIAETIANRSPC